MCPIKKEHDAPRPKLWKDQLGHNQIVRITDEVTKAFKSFKADAFVEKVESDGYYDLELKERIGQIADRLWEFLPDNYSRAINILIKIAPKLPEFENWCLTTVIEKYGLDDFDESIRGLKELTSHGTSEFGIRPFMIKYTNQIMPILMQWTDDPNEHIRRLAAEAVRPRGVWVAHIDKFKKNPTPVIELLDKLKADKSLYVRKAVANCLNDISKEHPDKVLAVAKRWQKTKCTETDWIVKRACRSLLKQGSPEALALFGFTKDLQIELTLFKFNPTRVKLGGEANISIEINSTASQPQKLSIDYAVTYAKKDKKRSRKVFKFSEKSLPASGNLFLSTKHSFRQMSTRQHYPGKHQLELIINGRTIKTIDFMLIK